MLKPMGNKRVTSQDVADLAGVSRTTVSFVLNNVFRLKPARKSWKLLKVLATSRMPARKLLPAAAPRQLVW
jgi:hypothetical protein